MKRAVALQRLAKIAEILRHAKLDALRCASDACNDTLGELKRLDGAMRPPCRDELPAPAATLYMSWSEQRRRALNTRLASQTAAWLEARDEAARSVGRHRVLTTLAGKPGRRR